MFFLLLGHLSSQNIHLTIKSLGTPEGADLGRGWGKQNTRSLKRVVNIMAKIKANSPYTLFFVRRSNFWIEVELS